jgi:hypothetical protein
MTKMRRAVVLKVMEMAFQYAPQAGGACDEWDGGLFASRVRPESSGGNEVSSGRLEALTRELIERGRREWKSNNPEVARRYFELALELSKRRNVALA